MQSPGFRIAVLGHGAIGQHVLQALQARLHPEGEFGVLGRKAGAQAPRLDASVQYFTSPERLAAWKPRLAVECAGHDVVATLAPQLLRDGTDVIVTSVGALGELALRQALDQAAATGQARVITVSGAIGGLDALSAACIQGPVSVTYKGRKPAKAWLGTPAEQRFALAQLTQPTVIFEGSAADAARLYPKNANVTAAVALAGVGFEQTAVELVADPASTANVHELDVAGPFGRFSIRLENNALPGNPKTSFLAALSVEAAIKKYLGETAHRP